MNLLQATGISTSLVRLVVAAGVATIYSDILNVTQKTGYRFDSFKILMLNVKLSDKQNKSVLSLALATVYRPPGPYTDFLKEFADFLSDLLVTVDKALIVGDFNIHVDNTNDALGLCVYCPNKLFWCQVMMLLTISLYHACCILLILTTIWLRVIAQAELLFQPLKTDSQITCLIYLNCSVYP